MSAQKKTLESIGVLDTIALDSIQTRVKLRLKTREELTKASGYPNLYDYLQNSKIGYICISKESTNIGYLSQGEEVCGWTAAFGEGLSLYIDLGTSYYYTSNIEYINWEEKYFDTKNSRYKFEFNEISMQEIMDYYTKNESKGQETE